MGDKTFNIRVYGLLLNTNDEILIVCESYKGLLITKFPGGGLEFGEGLKECLVREFKEELDLEIKIVSHFYTTDFFVESIFNHDNQIISVYFIVETDTMILDRFREQLKDSIENGELQFRWMAINKITEDDFTLPIDKHVVCLLKKTGI